MGKIVFLVPYPQRKEAGSKGLARPNSRRRRGASEATGLYAEQGDRALKATVVRLILDRQRFSAGVGGKPSFRLPAVYLCRATAVPPNTPFVVHAFLPFAFRPVRFGAPFVQASPLDFRGEKGREGES